MHFFINSLLVSSVTYELEITDDESINYTPKVIESNINKSVFLFASEDMELIEKYIMENRIVNSLDLKVYRIDKFDSITHSMIINSDQIQFLCSYQDSLVINNEKNENSFPLSFILSNNLKKKIVVCDKVANKQTENLVASEENQKMQFSNGLTFCPDACVIEWIYKDSLDSLKKNKILFRQLGQLENIFQILDDPTLRQDNLLFLLNCCVDIQITCIHSYFHRNLLRVRVREVMH